jgi:hypothetical protein
MLRGKTKRSDLLPIASPTWRVKYVDAITPTTKAGNGKPEGILKKICNMANKL